MFITTQHKENRLAKHAAEQLKNVPAKKVKRVKAGGDSVGIAPLTPGVNHPQEVLQAALAQDLSALHLLTDVKKKIALKKEQLIPKWQPIIQEYHDSGAQHPFEPLVWFAIWCVDAGEFEQGIAWADHAISQNQKLPERFKSTNLESVITRQIHDWALEQFKAEHSAEPYLTQVVERIESNQWLVSEPTLLGMLFKLVALYAEKEKQYEKSEAYFLKAVAVNEKHGVKGHLHRVQKILDKPLTQLK
jgi:tetratricopeptide (TPR) repeat protein